METRPNTNLQKTVLITGAANGIGYQLAYIFAQNNYNMVLVDKNSDKLAEMLDIFPEKFHVHVRTIVKDLSESTAPTEIYLELQQANIKIDVLVNNAGFGTYGKFAETSLDEELKMLQVNLVCLTHLTKLFLQDMVAQGHGKILNVASVAAFQPGPLMAVYFATKAYVLSFSEAIANELEGTGVSITALCPGPTATQFQRTAKMENSKIAYVKTLMDTQTVALMGYQGLMENKTIVIPGIKNKILAESIRFTPRKLVTKVVRSMHELQGSK
jgi:short-subunit dehydrogenase